MIVVDTSAIIAILQSEPEASDFLRILSNSRGSAIAAPTKFEALLVASKHPDGQNDVLELLDVCGIETMDWTSDHAAIAAQAFLRFGKGRDKAGLNYGDCMAYALAKSLDAPLLFKGDDFSMTDIRTGS